MRRGRLPVRLAIVVLGLLVAGLLAGRLLLTATHGSVLVLLSARQADHVGAMPVEAHSAAGWRSLGSLRALAVPKAPATATALQAGAPGGDYDSIRLGGQALTARFTVQRDLLATVLVSVAGGRPVANGVYAGSEAVSLGLDELASQVRALPPFTLTDQFGRPFGSGSIAGHDMVLAAFHTTCRETCPLYTGLFMQLRKQLPTDVLLVEATTDPWEDSPDVLRAYAGRVGASWTFLTGDPTALGAFWKPFDVELSTGDVHASTLALIDAHGYVRSFWQGAPDVGGSLPQALQAQLSDQGEQLLRSRGDGWGQAQVLDSLRAVGGLSQPSSAGQGQAADLTLRTLDGRQVSLRELRGRPVLVNFWATWCAPCRREMPLIEQTAARHPKVAVLLVDERDSRDAARGFANELHIRSSVLFDGNGAVGDRYGISGLPTTFFIRADGTVEGRYVGETNRQLLDSHIGAIGG
jgi:cytochrome c biogenesis protein CcmG/thiol:disulfide interchange protein DsbE